MGRSGYTPLMLHFDGVSFTTSPALAGMGELFGVDAVDSSEV